MTDRTHPDSGRATDQTHIIRFALELGLLWIDGSGRDKVREALDALDTLEAQLESIGAGGVNGPLMGAATPTAQAEGWRPISTAPRDGTEVLADTSGLGRVVVYWDDEESQWGTGLGYLDRGAPTHWMPLPPPPTSAEGVEHG